MINKKIILLTIFNISIFFNSYSNLTKAESIYYENNKWDFMEKEFVNKVDFMYKDPGVSPTFFILPLFLSCAAFFVKGDSDKKLMIFSISLVLLSITNYFRLEKKPRPIDIDQVEKNLLVVMNDFFENYSAEEKPKLRTNYRDFVPSYLVTTFDAIYKSYKEDGSKSLDFFLGIIWRVRDKIFYDVKKAKYQR